MPPLDKLTEYGIVGIILAVCLFAIGSLFWYIVRSHRETTTMLRDDAKAMRADSALERQRCMERDEKSLRYMRRMTNHQGRLAEAISRLADEPDSKKKTWGPT
jgi:hypothetical protein